MGRLAIITGTSLAIVLWLCTIYSAIACERPIIHEDIECGSAGCFVSIYSPSGFLLFESLGKPTVMNSCHNGLADIKFYKRTYPARSDGKALILILNYDGEKYSIKDQYIGN